MLVGLVPVSTEPANTTAPGPAIWRLKFVFESIMLFVISALFVAPPAPRTLNPPPAQLVISTFWITTRVFGVPAVPAILTPKLVKFLMVELRMMTCPRPVMLTPLTPLPLPSKSKPLSMTLDVAVGRFTVMPFVPDTSTPPTPDTPQMMVIDLVIVTAPNPPGSRQSISPSVAVFEIAPAKVLHAAVRLHGLASSPTPEIHVRVACALAGIDNSARHIALTTESSTELFISL